MKKTKAQQLTERISGYKIDGFSLDTFLEVLAIEKTPSDFIKHLNEKFNLESIPVESDDQLTADDYIKIINKEKKINVTGFGLKTEWTNAIRLYGNDIIGYYLKMLQHLRQTNDYTYNEKHEFLSKALLELSEMRNSVFIRNRFFFAVNTSFLYKKATERLHFDLMFHMLGLTDVIHNELKEIFQIRFELYDELLIQTKFMLSVLQNDRFKYSTFQLEPKDGKYIVMELVTALTAKNGYLKLDKPGKQQLIRYLFDLFGLEYKNIPGIEQDIYARKKKGLYLEKLAKLI